MPRSWTGPRAGPGDAPSCCAHEPGSKIVSNTSARQVVGSAGTGARPCTVDRAGSHSPAINRSVRSATPAPRHPRITEPADCEGGRLAQAEPRSGAARERIGRSRAYEPLDLPAALPRLTGVSPLQYQKQLCLQEARQLMLNENLDAGSAGGLVGYESPSQFSREYHRLLGAPPQRDVTRMRLAPVATPDLVTPVPGPQLGAPVHATARRDSRQYPGEPRRLLGLARGLR